MGGAWWVLLNVESKLQPIQNSNFHKRQAILAMWLQNSYFLQCGPARRKKKRSLCGTNGDTPWITIGRLNIIFEGYIMKNGTRQCSQWQMAIVKILLKSFWFCIFEVVWLQCRAFIKNLHLATCIQEPDTAHSAADRGPQLTAPQCFCSRAIQ